MADIIGEIVSGSGTSWSLGQTPVPNTVALYAGGIRLTPGAGNDYTINGIAITTVASYSAGQLTADYTPQTAVTFVPGIADQLSPYALTTLQRVKDILFDPNQTISLTGASLTEDSTSVTGITVQSGKTIRVGQAIMGTGIPSGTTISAVVSATQITLSQASTQTNAAQTLYVIDQPTAHDAVLVRMINWATNFIHNECGVLTFTQQTYTNDTYSIDNARPSFLQLRNTPVFSISSFQWRAGIPSNPSWTTFTTDDYELENPRTDPASGTVWYPSGTLRIYGGLPVGTNAVRATYVAGYPVDWSNPENRDTHWLPGDLTGLCENLVVRRFKRRDSGGKSSQSFEGSNITWRKDLDEEDKDVLGQYRQLNF